MKRKNWEPGGGKKELRGRDEWVRISWDEALDLVADETQRILDEHGNMSILGGSTVINALGGSMATWGTVSTGSFPHPTAKMGGGAFGSNDRLDWRNTKLIVIWGNPIWSSGGNPTYNYLQAKNAGAKFIFIDPFYNDSAQALADEWIPVRPGTDTAFLIGTAYHMIVNDLHDQEFLDKYCLGFDADHMPEGADPKENFKDYVLGTYDGVPKTPEWASEICGTHPDTIRSFAVQVTSYKPMTWASASAPSRTNRGEQFCQAFFTLGMMTGNLGISGGMITNTYHAGASYGGRALVRSGGAGAPFVPNPLFGYNFPYSAIPYETDWHGPVWDECWESILTGEYTASVRGKQPIDIQLIWNIRGGSGGNNLNQIPAAVKGIQAYRKVEFVVASDIVLSTKSKYADIVLPVTSPWEKPGGGLIGMASGEALLYFQQVTEPKYEAKEDMWVERELAKRLGVDPDSIHPLSTEQKAFNQLAGSTVILEDGSGYEPLVTITAADIAEMGVEGEPQTGRVTYQEFKERGVYQVPRSPGDIFEHIQAKAFRDDPAANPLGTASGKLEIHCQPLSDVIEAYGWDTLPPVAQYLPPKEGIEDTFSSFGDKVKGAYPLQLFTIHYGRRSHSVFDNIGQLRKAFPQEFMMNTLDAAERNIEHGDTVEIRSRHGAVLRPVMVTERMMPGVTTLGQGAWIEWDDDEEICKAGNTNILNGPIPSGQGVQGWNTCNVQVEKWNGDSLVPDVQWPQRIPIKEA
jgi:anaerobic dimethyl sulfoxide reductase subunit A